MDLCIENLKNNKSVPQSLIMLSKIIALYINPKRKKSASKFFYIKFSKLKSFYY